MALPDFRGSRVAGGSHGQCPLSPKCWDMVGMEGGSQSQEGQCGPPPLPVEEDVPEVGPR